MENNLVTPENEPIFRAYVKLRDLVLELEPEAVKVAQKHNKAAGTRLRKGLQKTKVLAQELRNLTTLTLKK